MPEFLASFVEKRLGGTQLAAIPINIDDVRQALQESGIAAIVTVESISTGCTQEVVRIRIDRGDIDLHRLRVLLSVFSCCRSVRLDEPKTQQPHADRTDAPAPPPLPRISPRSTKPETK